MSVCERCGIQHDPEDPHDANSVYYQHWFYNEHGRWATWKDAIEHCSKETQDFWEKSLKEYGAWTEPEADEVKTPEISAPRTLGVIRWFPDFEFEDEEDESEDDNGRRT